MVSQGAEVSDKHGVVVQYRVESVASSGRLAWRCRRRYGNTKNAYDAGNDADQHDTVIRKGMLLMVWYAHVQDVKEESGSKLEGTPTKRYAAKCSCDVRAMM
jgi:hypothetical protein